MRGEIVPFGPRPWLPAGAAGLLLTAASCAPQRAVVQPPLCPPVPGEIAVAAPEEAACDDVELASYEALLVLAPHPDDETLGFAGLRSVYREQDKPVHTVVVTDGDAYCEACSLWKSLSTRGATCDAEDLSNLATPEVDSFAEVRRAEAVAAAAVLGLPPPELLGYPDTGLDVAWANARGGRSGERLRRSDFSACSDCETCSGGYGRGPETDLTAATLEEALAARLAATSPRTLVATTHWLDGHGDHAALGNFVKTLNDALAEPRPVAYAVIHAHTPKETSHPDCWYPAPAAPVCPCVEEGCAAADPDRVASLRGHRLRPDWPAGLPDDASYGKERQLCLPEELYLGAEARKLRAIEAYPSQLGSLARRGPMPAHLDALMDCSGYLVSFVRRTEAFAFTAPGVSACEPAGTWSGSGQSVGEEPGEVYPGLTLSLDAQEGGGVSGELIWAGGAGAQVSRDVAGAVDERCEVELRATDGPEVTYRATVSRDRMSMYGVWDGDTVGYFDVHR